MLNEQNIPTVLSLYHSYIVPYAKMEVPGIVLVVVSSNKFRQLEYQLLLEKVMHP